MKKHRLTKRILALAAAAVMAVTALAGCGAGGSAGGDTGGSKALDTALEEAEPKVKDYAENQQRYSGLFFDKMLKTAGEAAKLVNADSSQDDLKNAVEKLKLDSVTVANERGLIVACYPEDEKGKKLKDLEDKQAFYRISRNLAVKLVKDPVPVEGTKEYTVLAGVAGDKVDDNGSYAIVVSLRTDEYNKVTGADIAESCAENTLVLSEGKVISSSMENAKVGSTTEELGIKDADVEKGSFSLTVGGTSYNCKGKVIEDYTLICAEKK